MAAVDHANKTGNYSVLRDLGSQAFQAGNNPATLGGSFANMRQQQLDLGDTLAVMPTFEIAEMTNPTVLRLRGAFATRPRPIQFDLLYAWSEGWRLDAVAIRAEP